MGSSTGVSHTRRFPAAPDDVRPCLGAARNNKVAVVGACMTHLMIVGRSFAALGITMSQWWVLAFISRKDGLPQTQLANELDVGKVGVGALIDRLESSGFVIRQADPVDRRGKSVYVTKQARGFLEKLRKETDKFNEKIARGIDRKQLEATSDALLAMKRNLLAMSDATVLAGSREEQDLGKKARPRKAKKAA